MSQYSAITKPNRINWGEQEYASQGKEGVANRCHLEILCLAGDHAKYYTP